MMNKNGLIEFLALLDKMQIHSNPYLTEKEKELYKHMIDQIKKQAQNGR
ncbi:MAG: hypothetical protein IJ299_02115 [Oscillospiraceae bacterium]|nr:hypothetical protein [Oscillospiraceae bacterium]